MIRFVFLMLATAWIKAAPAQEPAWPTKPIRWLVPFAPGGPAGVVARILAAGLADYEKYGAVLRGAAVKPE